jgi:hypothetical protein
MNAQAANTTDTRNANAIAVMASKHSLKLVLLFPHTRGFLAQPSPPCAYYGEILSNMIVILYYILMKHISWSSLLLPLLDPQIDYLSSRQRASEAAWEARNRGLGASGPRGCGCRCGARALFGSWHSAVLVGREVRQAKSGLFI